MNNSKFLATVRRFHGERPGEPNAMRTVTNYYISGEDGEFLLRSVRETFDGANKKMDIVHGRLTCPHNAEEAKQILQVRGGNYCEKCVHQCPRCGDWITPTDGEQIEGVWYHKHNCVESPKKHFELKRFLEEGFQIAKVQDAFVRIDLTKAQTAAIYHNIDLDNRRQLLEEKRAQAQIELTAAQTSGVYAGLHVQDKRLDMDERALDSKLESEQVQRVISERQSRLDSAERLGKLEEQGRLPKGTARKALR